MPYSGDPIHELVRLFARLPGVGERTAMRFVQMILAGDSTYAVTLGEALSTLHERVKRCEVCGNWGPDTMCSICLDPKRDNHVLCIVARVTDLIAVERTSTFRGRYHVLHALLAPLDGIGPEALPMNLLIERVHHQQVKEVIIATPLSVEGEATAHYIAEHLRPLGVSTTRIASGVAHGGELELTDHITLSRAFEGRRTL